MTGSVICSGNLLASRSGSDLMQLLRSLRTAGGVETIRMLCKRILQELIEAEASEAISVAPREHSEHRTT